MSCSQRRQATKAKIKETTQTLFNLILGESQKRIWLFWWFWSPNQICFGAVGITTFAMDLIILFFDWILDPVNSRSLLMMKHIDKKSWPQRPWSKRNWGKPRWMETGPKCGMQWHLQWLICKDLMIPWSIQLKFYLKSWECRCHMRYAVHLLSGMEQWILRSLSAWLLHESQEIEELRLIGEARLETLCGKDAKTPIYPHVCTYPLLVLPLILMNDACFLSLKKKTIVSQWSKLLLMFNAFYAKFQAFEHTSKTTLCSQCIWISADWMPPLVNYVVSQPLCPRTTSCPMSWRESCIEHDFKSLRPKWRWDDFWIPQKRSCFRFSWKGKSLGSHLVPIFFWRWRWPWFCHRQLDQGLGA